MPHEKALVADFVDSRCEQQTSVVHALDAIGVGLLVVIVVPMVVGIGRAVRRHLAARSGR